MRRMRRRRFRSSRKGYDWIVTQGDNIIVLNAATVDSTLAEFPLVTPDEVKEVGEPLMVERVVGNCWLAGPFSNAADGSIRGFAQIGWGIRVADTDASNLDLYLPVDVLADAGMDASWMFLRHQVLGNLGSVGGLPIHSNILNYLPNVATGGRHAPQGGPSFDINVKRKMSDTQTLTLSVATNTIPTWIANGACDSYTSGCFIAVDLSIRTLVRAIGR